MIHDYTVDDLIIILYDRYSLSDLEFALGVGLVLLLMEFQRSGDLNNDSRLYSRL